MWAEGREPADPSGLQSNCSRSRHRAIAVEVVCWGRDRYGLYEEDTEALSLITYPPLPSVQPARTETTGLRDECELHFCGGQRTCLPAPLLVTFARPIEIRQIAPHARRSAWLPLRGRRPRARRL